MGFGVVGVTIRDTPMETMNTVALTDTVKLELFGRMQDELGAQGVILSTCNRMEIYFAGDSPDLAPRMRALFTGRFPAAGKTAFLLEERAAVRHLISVAVGLESLVLGEDQIIGQVRQAHEFARRQQGGLRRLDKLFQGAVTAAKKIKTAYPVSSIPLSVSSIGIRLLRERCGLAGKTALVLGAGRMSRLAARYLLEEGAARVLVCSRREPERPEEFGGGTEFHPFARRYELLAQCDAAVSATSAPHTVLNASEFPPLDRPLALLDLAVPADIQPEAGRLPGVSLINMDTLRQQAEHNAHRREELARRAGPMIDGLTDALIDEVRHRQADRVITHLMDRRDALTADAMAFLGSHLQLSERETAVIERVLRSALGRMAREPVQALGRLDAGELCAGVAAAEYLFGLRDGLTEEETA